MNLVITTESDDVEVLVKQGGKGVRILDAKTGKEITLSSGIYELELKGAARGLKLSIDKATLMRGQTVLAKIERVPNAEASGLHKMELIRRIPVSAVRDLLYHTAISNGGKGMPWSQRMSPRACGWISLALPRAKEFSTALATWRNSSMKTRSSWRPNRDFEFTSRAPGSCCARASRFENSTA